jgi:hypothetical protein
MFSGKIYFKLQIFLGVLAQEVKEIIPDAVVESSDVVLSNGVVIDKLLHVNKVFKFFLFLNFLDRKSLLFF